MGCGASAPQHVHARDGTSSGNSPGSRAVNTANVPRVIASRPLVQSKAYRHGAPITQVNIISSLQTTSSGTAINSLHPTLNSGFNTIKIFEYLLLLLYACETLSLVVSLQDCEKGKILNRRPPPFFSFFVDIVSSYLV